MEDYYTELIAYACDADARTVDDYIAQMADTLTLEFAMGETPVVPPYRENCSQ